MLKQRPRFVFLIVTLLFAAGCTSSRPAVQPDQQGQGDASNGSNGDLKAMSEVIPDDAEADSGLFNVYRADDKLFYEIPDTLLEEELLLVSRIARTADEIGYGGEKANTQVVRWQRQADKVLLRRVSYENVADEEKPIYEAVRNANFEPILASFDVAALNEDSSAVVVEVSSLFTSDVPSLGLQQSRRERYKVRRLDGDRTFVTEAKSFPRNIEVRNVLTYEAQEPPSNESTGTISLEMNHSMVKLPENPMQPRPCDPRVGFFSVERTNYGLDRQQATEECFITRWRLEPKDTEAFERGELVEPKKPIVYYIDPATPEKWRPYLKQGVEDWNEAFEAAGFKNAIMAKDAPTEEEDPEFSPEDVRYSVIRYFPSETQNAYGPHVHDPRSGEILESDIGWFHNVMNLLRNWYFVQTAASNPEARGVEFADEVMGELVRFVAAHEVGHTLGLPHNWGSSVAFPVDSLRSPSFTATHGTAPSIMDYARFNYVAQAGDGVRNFFPRIGTYDEWSIRWGYRPIPDASSLQAQEDVLDEWVEEKAGDPLYFYGRQTGNPIDPRSQREDLGADAVKASEYGIANLQRIVDNLEEWTYQEGEGYDELEELYEAVVAQWRRYAGHVARNIGGVYETPKEYDQQGPVFVAVPADDQRDAMAFLQAEVFQTPQWLLDQDLLSLIEHAGSVERIREAQVGALGLVMDAQRLARMIEAEALLGDEVYAPLAMLEDLRRGVWAEVYQREDIDPFRRNLQRGYLEQAQQLMTEEVEAPPARYREYFGFTPVDVSQSDIRAYVRGELQALQQDVRQALRRTTDRATELHLRDVLVRIDRILNPES